MTKQQRQKRYKKTEVEYYRTSKSMQEIFKSLGESIHRSAFRAAAKAAADHVGVEVQGSATAQAILRAGRK